MNANKPTQPSKAQRKKWAWLSAAAFGLGLVGLGIGWWHTTPVSLPNIDLHRIDPKVAHSLQERIEEVRRHPRSAPAWGWLGALLSVYDFRPEARECLAQAERLDASNPRWPYLRALSLMVATPNVAIPLLERTVHLCGNDPEAPRFRLAHLLAEQGQWDAAGRQLDPLLSERPQFKPARLLAARVAQARGEIDKALDLARSGLDDPRTARSASLLVVTLCREKSDAPGAAEALQRAAKLPADEGIADPFQAELALLRGDPRVLCEQAHPLLAAGHLAEAAAVIERLQKEHPDNAETWLLAGRLALLRKDPASADQLLRHHLEMDPRSVQGLFQLGMVLLARERWIEAAATFQQAIELKRDFGPAYFNRGVALGRAGQFRDAMAAFRESLRHSPERVESYLLLADLHLRLGEKEPARALLDQARTLSPNDPRLAALNERLRVR